MDRSLRLEALEGRLLLSGSAPVIPAGVVGPVFAGTIHLRDHIARRVVTQSMPVAFQFSSLDNGVIDGIATSSAGEVDFRGPIHRRSFAGVFADGTINGTFNIRGTIVSGSLHEIVNGQLISGHFYAAAPGAGNSAVRMRDAGSSTVTTGVTSTGIKAAGIFTGSGSSGRPTPSSQLQTISLPALETTLTTPVSLNPNTTYIGFAAGSASVAKSVAEESMLAGTGTNAPGVQATNNSTGNQVYSFSTSSGVVSITNSGTTFTSSSGIVSITAAPTYSTTSGISTVAAPGT